jgi:hypothetical protein
MHIIHPQMVYIPHLRSVIAGVKLEAENRSISNCIQNVSISIIWWPSYMRRAKRNTQFFIVMQVISVAWRASQRVSQPCWLLCVCTNQQNNWFPQKASTSCFWWCWLSIILSKGVKTIDERMICSGAQHSITLIKHQCLLLQWLKKDRRHPPIL